MSAETGKSPRRPSSARIPAAARQAVSQQADAARTVRTEASPGDASGSGQLSKRRRRHKAAGGRIAASGLGAGALFGIIGALGAHAASTGSSAKAVSPPRAIPTAAVARRPAPTTTPTTIVWQVVHRVVVVTDPPVMSSSGSNVAARRTYAPPYSPSAACTVNIASPASAPVASSAPVAAPVPAAAPAPAPAPPACSGTKCP